MRRKIQGEEISELIILEAGRGPVSDSSACDFYWMSCPRTDTGNRPHRCNLKLNHDAMSAHVCHNCGAFRESPYGREMFEPPPRYGEEC